MRVINLLPKSEREYLVRQKIYISLRKFVLLSFGTYIFILLVLFAARFYNEFNLNNLNSELAEVDSMTSKESNNAMKAKLDQFNGVFLDYNNIASANPSWSPILEEFSNLVTVGVYISSFGANTKSGRIDITGFSRSRDSILHLRESIESSDSFKDVDFPFENLQKPGNLNFRYSFFLEENALKGKQ